MARTRVFKSGNSQAVRIPAELAYADMDMELEIARHGDVITIYPARQNLKRLAETLRRMPKPATVEELERTEVRDREGA